MLGSELWRRDAGKTIVDKWMLGTKLPLCEEKTEGKSDVEKKGAGKWMRERGLGRMM